jgi:hypothetical protein
VTDWFSEDELHCVGVWCFFNITYFWHISISLEPDVGDKTIISSVAKIRLLTGFDYTLFADALQGSGGETCGKAAAT